MNRRDFVTATGLGGLAMASSAAGANTKPAILELRRFQLRNTADDMRKRTSDFLKNTYVPALQRAGSGPVGVFASAIAPEGPFLLMLTSYPSLAVLETAMDKLSNDKEYVSQLDAYNASGMGYVRMEVTLLRAFDTTPAIEVPPVEANRPPRIFELRMYESNNLTTLRKKIGMFNGGEIGVFKRLNMMPVFFGETIAGTNMPNLVYMLSFDDLAARDKAWKAFGGDPEWQKLRSTPGLSDAEIVSNISNVLLSPAAFSAIR